MYLDVHLSLLHSIKHIIHNSQIPLLFIFIVKLLNLISFPSSIKEHAGHEFPIFCYSNILSIEIFFHVFFASYSLLNEVLQKPQLNMAWCNAFFSIFYAVLLYVWEWCVKGYHKNWSTYLLVLDHILQGLCPGDGFCHAEDCVHHAWRVAHSSPAISGP